MSKIGVSISIDVTKIVKEALFTGKKGKYMDAKVFIDLGEADQYGNHGMVTQELGRDSKEKGPILGNVKIFWREAQATIDKPPQQGSNVPNPVSDDFSDEIPF